METQVHDETLTNWHFSLEKVGVQLVGTHISLSQNENLVK